MGATTPSCPPPQPRPPPPPPLPLLPTLPPSPVPQRMPTPWPARHCGTHPPPLFPSLHTIAEGRGHYPPLPTRRAQEGGGLGGGKGGGRKQGRRGVGERGHCGGKRRGGWPPPMPPQAGESHSDRAARLAAVASLRGAQTPLTPEAASTREATIARGGRAGGSGRRPSPQGAARERVRGARRRRGRPPTPLPPPAAGGSTDARR